MTLAKFALYTDLAQKYDRYIVQFTDGSVCKLRITSLRVGVLGDAKIQENRLRNNPLRVEEKGTVSPSTRGKTHL